MQLLDLPLELLVRIVETVDSEKDISTVARTSRYLYDVFNSFLYRHNIRHSGRSTLQEAIKKGSLECVRGFLKSEARSYLVDNPESEEWPLICLAARHEKIEVVQLLLQEGANPNARYKDTICLESPWLHQRVDETSLSYAARRGIPELAKVLLAADGIDVDPKDKCLDYDDPDYNGLTPLLWAVKADSNEVQHRGIPHGCFEVIRLLVAKGADINHVDCDHNLLTHAVSQDNMQMVKHLLQNGADPDSNRPGEPTLLMMAVYAGNINLVRILLHAGANPNARDEQGNAPLHLAAKAGCNTGMKDLLLRMGAKDDGFGIPEGPLSFSATMLRQDY